jgi:hypothetical protein
MSALDDLDSLAMDAAAPIPALQALLGMEDLDSHLRAIKELLGIVNDRLAQIDDAVGRLKAAEGG